MDWDEHEVERMFSKRMPASYEQLPRLPDDAIVNQDTPLNWDWVCFVLCLRLPNFLVEKQKGSDTC